MMNKNQKIAIENLRRENYSYAFIASKLELNPNTVKSYCRRHGVLAVCGKRKRKAEKLALLICLSCGKPIENDWNRVGKRFCSDKCRTAYWNAQKRKKGLSAPSAPSSSAIPTIALAPGGGAENKLPEGAGLLAEVELSSRDRR